MQQDGLHGHVVNVMLRRNKTTGTSQPRNIRWSKSLGLSGMCAWERLQHWRPCRQQHQLHHWQSVKDAADTNMQKSSGCLAQHMQHPPQKASGKLFNQNTALQLTCWTTMTSTDCAHHTRPNTITELCKACIYALIVQCSGR